MSTIHVPRTVKRPGATLALLAFAQLIISVDYNIVYVALPDIGRDLGFSVSSLQWVISAYAVAFGGLLLLGGRACDRVGPRRIFTIGLLTYGVASLAGSLATSPALLISARAGQGLGGALLFPATLTLISVSFAEGRERHRAFAVWGTAGGSGMILGSLLGGVLTDWFGWSAVFFVNVPLVAIAVLLVRPLLTADAPKSGTRSFGLPSALTATAGITLIVFAIVQGPVSGWVSTPVMVAFAAGVGALLAYAFLDRRSRDPLVPAQLTSNRQLRLGVTITFLYMATFGTLLYFLTTFFQDVQHRGPLATGLAFLVPMAAIAIGAQTAGRLAPRFGAIRLMIASLLIGGVGTVLLFLAISTNVSYPALMPALIVTGLGQGAGYTLMFGIAATGVAAHQQGTAAGLASTTQQIGGAVGLAVLIAIAQAATAGDLTSRLVDIASDQVRIATLAAAIGIFATAALTWAAHRRTQAAVLAPSPVSTEPAPVH